MLFLARRAVTGMQYHSRWNTNSLISREGILIHPFKHWITGGKYPQKSLIAPPSTPVNTFPMGNPHPQENLYIGHSLAKRDTLRGVSTPQREVSWQNMKHQESLTVLICDLTLEKIYFSEICSIWHWPHDTPIEKKDRRDQARPWNTVRM